ncbi:MAG: hypothetical protein N2C12_06885, partial [Planctomycetales bacterium]
EAIRMIGSDTAIEDGQATLNTKSGSAQSRYTAVHVRQDGKWWLSSVRDYRVDRATNSGRLQDVAWLIGDWQADRNGAHMQMTCRWIANKNYIERTFQVSKAQKVVSSGVQIIGYSPVFRQVTSWIFSSDGGHAVGSWSPHAAGWTIRTFGVTANGTPTSAVNVLTKLDDGAIAWRSQLRTAGGMQIPDATEVVLKRVTPSSQQ